MFRNVTKMERPRYIDRLVPFVNNGNVKIIVGMRRCGKSSLLRTFLSEPIIIDTESGEGYQIRDWKALLARIESELCDRKGRAVVIEEVQNVEGWELALCDILARGLCNLYVTSSNSDILSSENSTLLGGRFNLLRMYPLSYSECPDFGEADTDVFDRFSAVGGMPALWQLPLDRASSLQMVRDVVDVSISNDIGKTYNVKNRALLIEILRRTLSRMGGYVTVNGIFDSLKADGIKTSADTVYEYLAHMESANVLIRIDTLNIRAGTTVPAKYRYYAADVGIRYAMIGRGPLLESAEMENMILIELLGRDYIVHVGDNGGKEVTFVAERFGERMYVQVCQMMGSEEAEVSMCALESIRDSFPKYVVTANPGAYAGTTSKGIICCGLREFLLNGA